MWKILGLAILVCVFQLGFGETGCPEAGDIEPCKCTQGGPYTYLKCRNITDVELLRQVFANSNRYTYKEVHIEHSTMQYLPSEMFENTEIHELYLKFVTLSNLFDKTIQNVDHLRLLHIWNTRVLRGIFWRILEPMKNLKILNIFYNSIRTLGKDFSDYAPRELEQLTFYATGTRTIKPGVFANFTKLDVIGIDAGKIETLTRDIFPTPFNVRVLDFNGNKISNISDGLFKDMPNLKTLGLRENRIATLPKEAFDSPESFERITYLRLDDNPLECDCLLSWLVDHKPEVLEGKCVRPRRLKGRDLKDLIRTDFNC